MGSPWSMRTVSFAPAEAGAQFETLPAASTERNWTSVSPLAVTLSTDPVRGVPQVMPPSVDSRYW